MKFYQSRDFKILHAEWKQKLEDSGFTDIETPREQLINHDIRTIAWENRDKILSFFLRLDTFINSYEDMPPSERKVMSLYSQGTFIKDIARQTNVSYRHITNIISRYKGLLKAFDQMNGHADFPE